VVAFFDKTLKAEQRETAWFLDLGFLRFLNTKPWKNLGSQSGL
jgi:hypothetical protein